MGKPRRVGDLELGYDPAHEEREWIAQRFAWVLMVLFVLAALLGFLGAGLMSHDQAGRVGSPLYVEYRRFARYQAPAELKVFVRPGNGDTFTVALDRGYVSGIEIEEIVPEPAEVAGSAQEYVMTFNRAAGDQQLVLFRIKPAKFGALSTRVRLDGKESVQIKQFNWP